MSFDFSAAQVRDYSDEARARRAYGRGTIIIYALWDSDKHQACCMWTKKTTVNISKLFICSLDKILTKVRDFK